MVTETDGLILRQIKLPDDRRMLVLFTRKFGKISAGTSVKLNARNKSSLALRAFTHGKYELFKGREIFNINAAETLESFYRIGDDIDKYMLASYAVEFTDKVVPEGQQNEKILDDLIAFLRILSARKKQLKSLLVIYQWKLLFRCGYMPELDQCSRCGKKGNPAAFSIVDGGVVCEECRASGRVNQKLLYELRFDIIKTLKFIAQNDMQSFGKLALKDEITEYFEEIIRQYVSYHLDIGKLKSESFITI